jgi:PAS domain S-box-containing protein
VQTNAAAHKILKHIGLLESAARPVQERLTTVVVANTQGQRLMPEQLPLSRILQGERITPEHAMELQMPQRGGEVLHASISGGPIRDARGEIIGAVAISRDISGQKRAEREREEQAQQLRTQASLIELAYDAILVGDPQGHIVSWNRGAERFYGWTAQEAVGHITYLLFQTRFPVPRQEVDRLLEQEGMWEGELVQACRDGRLVVVESRWALLRDAQEQPSAILEINRDITERRRLERFEREVHAQMEDRLNLLQVILNE